MDDETAMAGAPAPLIVQYLYVHEPDEAFYYPSARASSSIARVAARYLECALTQAATLRLAQADCELVLATNVTDRRVLGRRGTRLLESIERLGVQIMHTEYRHRPPDNRSTYVSSRYVLDAILAAADGQPGERQLWFTDVDCVWVNAQKLFAAFPPPGEIGCVFIPYPPDWDTIGFGEEGRTREEIGQLAARMGGSGELPAWIGGELLGGTPEALRGLVRTCERLDEQLTNEGRVLATEEQIMSLGGALGQIHFRDLSDLAWRVLTGSRHMATPLEDPLSLALWHLPSEKGLSLRRAADQVLSGRSRRLRRDLAEPRRLGRRFNVAGTGLARRLRDDSWIAGQRIANAARSRLGASG
jgi:hypothetical protein